MERVAESRSQTGCQACRRRRVKCDEKRPVCDRCARRQDECIWSTATRVSATNGQASGSLGSHQRRRNVAACIECRRRKKRCDGPTASKGSACAQCRRSSLVCQWDASGRQPKVIVSQQAGSESARTESPVSEAVEKKPLEDPHRDGQLPSDWETRELVSRYFRTVHQYGFYTFVHEASFFRLLESHTAPKELLHVMIACVLRFAGDGTDATLARAEATYQEVVSDLRQRIYFRFGCLDLMTILLAQRYEHGKGNFAASGLFWSNAVKIMQILSIHSFDETYPNAKRLLSHPLLKTESIRRIAWSVFFLDATLDAGRHGVHTVEETGVHLQLPCDEADFAKGNDVLTVPLKSHGPLAPNAHRRPIEELGISAHLIQTVAVRRQILHFNSKRRYSYDDADTMLQQLSLIEANLKEVITCLPERLMYTEKNLALYAENRTSFVLLHILRHSCFLVLARTRMNICGEQLRFADLLHESMRDRIRHALSVSRMVVEIQRLGVDIDPFVAVQAYSALEVLLYDPHHLLKVDGPLPKPDYRESIKPLMAMLRKTSRVHVVTSHLRVEATLRLLYFGYPDLVTEEDHGLCHTGRAPGVKDWPPTSEYHFHATPQAAQALLDLGGHPASQAPETTEEEPIDASLVSTQDKRPSQIALRPSSSLQVLNQTIAGELGPISSDSPMPFSFPPLDIASNAGFTGLGLASDDLSRAWRPDEDFARAFTSASNMEDNIESWLLWSGTGGAQF